MEKENTTQINDECYLKNKESFVKYYKLFMMVDGFDQNRFLPHHIKKIIP